MFRAGGPDYKCILVYDISRWGRFQDADESAYYEYLCQRAGIAVHYCAEQFENDGSNSSSIISKASSEPWLVNTAANFLPRYSKGRAGLIQLGFKQGGTAGFGLRRMLVDHTGQQRAC